MTKRKSQTISEKNRKLKHDNEELQLMNEDLNEMMRAARIGNWMVDLVNDRVFWSPMIYEIHEVPLGAELKLEDGINYYHPDHRALIKQVVSNAIEKEQPWDMELKLLTATNKPRWVRTIGRPLKENDKVVKLKGLFQDIHEAKLRQKKIEESERMLREGQKVGRFGNWDWDMLENDLNWSDELYVIFGQKPQSFEATYEALMSMVHPDDREKMSRDVERAISENKPHDLTHRIVWPNGEVRFVHERGIVYYNEQSQPVRMTGTTQDVTERFLAEQELLESETALKQAEKIAHVGNWKWYIDENKHTWSDERYRILDYEPHEIEPSMEVVIETIHPKDLGKVTTTIEKAIKNEGDYVLEYRIITRSGFEKVVKEKAKWMSEKGSDHKNIYLGTVQDITTEFLTKQKLEDSLEALQQSNSELKNFAYVASHDLQEPLRVITSYLQLIDMGYKDKLDDEGQEFLNNTIKASARMKALITDLLSLSKLEKVNNKKEMIDCQKLLEGICSDIQMSIVESGAKISFHDLPKVYGDEVQLRQLFQNLLINGIKFRKKDESPLVKVSAKRQSKKTEFSISDNGIGIEPKYFDRIFDIFQRLHTKEEYQGTGMGLAICKKIVEHHGGKISVTSGPNKGSIFSFTIES